MAFSIHGRFRPQNQIQMKNRNNTDLTEFLTRKQTTKCETTYAKGFRRLNRTHVKRDRKAGAKEFYALMHKPFVKPIKG